MLPAFETAHNPNLGAAHAVARRAVKLQKKQLKQMVDERLVHQFALYLFKAVSVKQTTCGACWLRAAPCLAVPKVLAVKVNVPWSAIPWSAVPYSRFPHSQLIITLICKPHLAGICRVTHQQITQRGLPWARPIPLFGRRGLSLGSSLTVS